MLADEYQVGRQFKHVNCGIVEIVEVNGEKYFENDNGDLFEYIDNDLIEYEF